MRNKNEINEQPTPTPITRVEVINHAKNDKPIGRLLTLYKEK